MKILLINPAYPPKTIGFKRLLALEPMALEYMGAILSEHDVRILDMVIDPDINAELHGFRPDIACMSAFFTHRDSICGLFGAIKRFDPKIITILGGSHVTLAPGQYETNSINILALGDNLHLIKDIVDNFANLAVVKNIHYQFDGNWIRNARELQIANIDELPFPERKLTARFKDRYFWYFHKNIATVWGSVGCPFKCYYCTQWTKNGGRFIARSPESLVAEIEQIEEDTVFIVDDNTFTNTARAREIYALIKEKGIKKQLVCYCSPNLIIKNEQLLRDWASIGLVKIMVGFESLRPKDLSDVHNKTSLDANREAVRILHDIGLDTMAGFIIYPDFTVEDFKALRNFVKESKLYYIEYTSLTPFPGTAFYDEHAPGLRRFPSAMFDMQHMLLKTALPLKKYYYNVAKLYLASYMPWRAAAAKLHFPISKNPFHPIYRNFVKMLWDNLTAHKHHSIEEVQDEYS
jgi:radical SAM superfamily enzyme YgiQ (UPF0313 family)